MEHNICRENLSAYLDNELPAEEKLSLESHLASCAACVRELAELRRVSAVFKKHVMQPVPAALKEEVFAEKPAAPFFSGWLKPVLVLSATAAGLLVIFGLPKFRQQGQTYSPALFSNAYEEKGAIQVAAADKSEGPVSSFSGEMSGASEAAAVAVAKSAGQTSSLYGGISGGSGSAMSASSLNSPRSSGKGAYGQAKFSGRGSLKAQAEKSASSVPLTGDPALVAFFAEGKDKAEAAVPASAGAARPAWLDEKIRNLQAGQRGNPPYTVWRYSYEGKTVYYLPPQCCDQYSELYNEAGKLLCAPDGGKTGGGDGRCADFYKLRTGGELIWRDPRK